ncbi:hypothetical protein HWV62_35368 [Athelia sp. TMB]|nr:hypothetical protein HWV62_35368 [Athelia sp. TMB]
MTLLDVHLDLKTLDEALSQLRGAQEQLQLKRDVLQSYTEEHSALMSPVRRLPLETLSEIFANFLPEDIDDEDTSVARRERMLPSHICAGWRALSLATPNYWAQINVNVDRWHMDRKLECAKAWLARSATTDLSSIKSNLPMLESLQMSFAEWPKDAPFEIAPNLHRVAMPVSEGLPDDSLPWAQLTDLEVFYGTVEQCAAVMQKLPNLIYLEVTITKPDLGPLNCPLLRLQNLEWLKITADHGIAYFQEFLDLPSLWSYTCIESAPTAGWTSTSFLSLLSRSSCHLEELEVLLTQAIDVDDMALLLQRLPDLQYLDFQCNPISGINSNNIQKLLTCSTASFVLPQLTYLILDYDEDFDFDQLITMLKSHRVASSQQEISSTADRGHLHSVDIYNFNVESQEGKYCDLITRLDELLPKAGVRLTFISGKRY